MVGGRRIPSTMTFYIPKADSLLILGFGKGESFPFRNIGKAFPN